MFKKAKCIIKIKGKIVIQAITMNDKQYDHYRKGTDWIRKYIFPGGHLPSVGYIKQLIEDMPLTLEKLDDISLHYVQTLEDWKQAFVEKIDDVKSLGFDEEFQRKWIYYFCYSQAGFQSKYIKIII